MKKFLVAIFALAVAASVAFAGVGIQWSTSYGVYDSDASDLQGSSNYILDNYSVIWQLIYTATDTIEPPNFNNAAGGYVSTAPTANDVVWATRTIPQGGGTAPEDGSGWNNYLSQQSGTVVYEDLAWVQAGFVYQRIFEGTPVAGSMYYDTATMPLNTGYGGAPASPDVFNVDQAGQGASGVQPNQTIPEPATMSLLGLGALAMVLRRKIRK